MIIRLNKSFFERIVNKSITAAKPISGIKYVRAPIGWCYAYSEPERVTVPYIPYISGLHGKSIKDRKFNLKK